MAKSAKGSPLEDSRRRNDDMQQELVGWMANCATWKGGRSEHGTHYQGNVASEGDHVWAGRCNVWFYLLSVLPAAGCILRCCIGGVSMPRPVSRPGHLLGGARV